MVLTRMPFSGLVSSNSFRCTFVVLCTIYTVTEIQHVGLSVFSLVNL
jgi:hypothetical protein